MLIADALLYLLCVSKQKPSAREKRINEKQTTTTTKICTKKLFNKRKKSRRNSNKCLKSIATSEAFDRYRQRTRGGKQDKI